MKEYPTYAVQRPENPAPSWTQTSKCNPGLVSRITKRNQSYIPHYNTCVVRCHSNIIHVGSDRWLELRHRVTWTGWVRPQQESRVHNSGLCNPSRNTICAQCNMQTHCWPSRQVKSRLKKYFFSVMKTSIHAVTGIVPWSSRITSICRIHECRLWSRIYWRMYKSVILNIFTLVIAGLKPKYRLWKL